MKYSDIPTPTYGTLIVNNNLHELLTDANISFEARKERAARNSRTTCKNGQPARVLAGNLFLLSFGVSTIIDGKQWRIDISDRSRPFLAENQTMEVTLPPLQSMFRVDVDQDGNSRHLSVRLSNTTGEGLKISQILKSTGPDNPSRRISPPTVKVYREKAESPVAQGSMSYG